MPSKIYNFSDEEFTNIIATHNSYTDCARACGLSPYGGNAKIQLKKRIEELNLDISHFNQQANAKKALPAQDLDTILVKNSTYQNITRLKKRILDAKLLEYKCAICGNVGEWNGQSLVLQLDHINGEHYDHRLENLRFLCPNCHSQTDTFSGKNKK